MFERRYGVGQTHCSSLSVVLGREGQEIIALPGFVEHLAQKSCDKRQSLIGCRALNDK